MHYPSPLLTDTKGKPFMAPSAAFIESPHRSKIHQALNLSTHATHRQSIQLSSRNQSAARVTSASDGCAGVGWNGVNAGDSSIDGGSQGRKLLWSMTEALYNR